MRRRDFITLLGSAAAWPLAAHAQQRERMRLIGVLMLYPDSDPQGQLRATAFRQVLEKLGWTVGRDVQIDFRWGLGDTDWIRSAAAQLLQLAPDLILANGDAATRVVQQSPPDTPSLAPSPDRSHARRGSLSKSHRASANAPWLLKLHSPSRVFI